MEDFLKRDFCKGLSSKRGTLTRDLDQNRSILAKGLDHEIVLLHPGY